MCSLALNAIIAESVVITQTLNKLFLWSCPQTKLTLCHHTSCHYEFLLFKLAKMMSLNTYLPMASHEVTSHEMYSHIIVIQSVFAWNNVTRIFLFNLLVQKMVTSCKRSSHTYIRCCHTKGCHVSWLHTKGHSIHKVSSYKRSSHRVSSL